MDVWIYRHIGGFTIISRLKGSIRSLTESLLVCQEILGPDLVTTRFVTFSAKLLEKCLRTAYIIETNLF